MTQNQAPSPPKGGPTPNPTFDGPHEELFDWQRLRHLGFFSFNSVRRRLELFLAVSGGMVLLAAVALEVMPKTYEVRSRLLAQRSAALASRVDTNQLDQPNRAAPELILRTENLHAVIEQTNLLQEWPKRRAPILRLKDWVMDKLVGPPKQKEMLRSLTGLLNANFNVWITNDGTIDLKLHWPDPVMAYRLVDATTSNFLKHRHELEVAPISEQVSILEVYAAHLKEDIDKQVAAARMLRDSSAPRRPRATRPQQPAAPLVPKPPDPEEANLRAMLETKRRSIADLEEMRRRRLQELQTQLTEQRAVYSENHPVLLDLQQQISSLRGESPQQVTLRQEEAELRLKLSKYPNSGVDLPTSVPVIPPDLFRVDALGGEDPLMENARGQLRYTLQQYANMRERINAARIDMDTAEAAFKYRYSVLQPPEVPRGPIRPKAPLVMIAALLAGLMLALFATTAADLRSGVVLESWQLENAVGRGRAIIEVRSP